MTAGVTKRSHFSSLTFPVAPFRRGRFGGSIPRGIDGSVTQRNRWARLWITRCRAAELPAGCSAMSDDSIASLAVARGRHGAKSELPGWVEVGPGAYYVGPPGPDPSRGGERGGFRARRLPGQFALAGVAGVVVVLVLLGFSAIPGTGAKQLRALPTVAPSAISPAIPSSSPTTPSLASASPGSATTEPDWIAVIARLDAGRARALMSGSVADLAAFDAHDSPAWRADEAALAKLAVSRLRPRGLANELITVARWRVPTGTPGASTPPGPADAVVLRVVDRRKPYRLVDETGAIGDRVAAGAKRRWLVTLVPVGEGAPTDPGWRIWQVVAG